jgi:hypothetical protein
VKLPKALSLLISTAFLHAQDDNQAHNYDCPAGPQSIRIDARHLEYQGVGFDKGYSTIDLFLSNAEPWIQHNVFFLDLRGHVFNDGKPAANAGVGWRYLFDSHCRAFGFNTYYDYRKTIHKNYQQAGAGLEYLTPRWEFRANGYLPFGSKVSHHFDLKFDRFSGHSFYVSRKHEFAMAGGDAELGRHFKHWKNIDLFAAVGAYYFKGHFGKAAAGGKARMQARMTPYVTLEIGDSYDAVFHNRFHAELTLSLPLGPRTKFYPEKPCSCTNQNMLQQWLHDAPSRFEILVVDTKKKTSRAIDPVTGLPYFFVFVNNLSSSSGTFESPYPSLAAAELNSTPGDVIYVSPGNGTTANMDMGITLKANQRFLGSGVFHEFQTTLGSVKIPAQTSSSPQITNAGPVVVLNLNNEVSGFDIAGGTIGIYAAPATWTSVATSVNINRNIIQNTGVNGIELNPISSQAVVQITDNTLSNILGRGILVPYQDSLGSALIQNNRLNLCQASLANGGAIEMINTGATDVQIQCLNNSFFNAGTPGVSFAILVTANSSITPGNARVETILDGNTFDAHPFASPAVSLQNYDNGTHISTVRNNLFRGSLGTSAVTMLEILVDLGALPSSQTITMIDSNVFRGGGEGISINTIGAGFLQATIIRNHLTNIYGPGGLQGAINLSFNGTGTSIADVSSNFIDQVGRFVNPSSGINFNIVTAAPAQTSLVCNGNAIANAFGAGIRVRSIGPTVAFIESNQISHCGLSSTAEAIKIEVQDVCRARVNDNQFNDNLLGDFQAQISPTGTLCIGLNGNSSSIGYYFNNASGGTAASFLLEPLTNSNGGAFIDGPFTNVAPGSCN